MIKISLKKILPTLFIVYLVSFLGLFLFYLIFPPEYVTAGSRFAYILRYSFLVFLDFLIPVQCTGLLLAYGLFITDEDLTSTGGSTHPFHQAVSPVLVFLLVLALIYTLLMAWVYSSNLKKLHEIEHKTALFDNYYEKAQEARDSGKHEDALRYINQCLLLDEASRRALEFFAEVQGYLLDHNSLPVSVAPEPERALYPEAMDVDELVSKARHFFYQEDWFSAYYYASLAGQWDTDNLVAAELVRETTNRIENISLSMSDRQQKELFERKKTGFDALQNGRYVAAYYIFLDLLKDIPQDSDIATYMQKAVAQLKRDTFFVEDAAYALSLPGTEDIFFENTLDAGVREYFFIGKMVKFGSDIYFNDVEIIRISASGSVKMHMLAEYGKYVYADLPREKREGNAPSIHNISVNCISREKDVLNKNEEYLVSPAGENLPLLFSFVPHPDNFERLSFRADKYRTLGIVELLQLKEILPDYGYQERGLNLELLSRGMLPFSFLIFSFFSIALGWRLRSRYEARPPVLAILFIPLFPVVVSVICRLLIFTWRLIFAFTLISFGLFVSVLIGICLQLILLVIAMFIVAGQDTI